MFDKMTDKSRVYGLLICLGTVVAGIFFVIGIVQRNYWAVAVPVIIGFLTVLALGFWIGWTIVTVKTESPTPAIESQPQPETKKEEPEVKNESGEQTPKE